MKNARLKIPSECVGCVGLFSGAHERPRAKLRRAIRPGANLIDANSTLPFSRCTKFGALTVRARFLYERVRSHPHARMLYEHRSTVLWLERRDIVIFLLGS